MVKFLVIVVEVAVLVDIEKVQAQLQDVIPYLQEEQLLQLLYQFQFKVIQLQWEEEAQVQAALVVVQVQLE